MVCEKRTAKRKLVMKKIVSKDLDFDIQLEAILSLDRGMPVDVNETVKNIISDVKANGDESVIKLTNKLDNNDLSLDNILVSQDEIESASKNISDELKQAIQLSHDRVTAYHQKQLPEDRSYKDELGIELGYVWNCIESAGVYVPGGTASYPSSVIMNTVPAKVAGVENVIMVTPANGGKINPLVLYAAKISGVNKIFKIGGAQAIAALAYGTKTITPVNVIVGPGNAYVAEAKKMVYGDVGVDMVAGPSEILIIADKNQDARNIAADLISQAEHDVSAQSIFITDDITLAENVELEVAEQLVTLPRKVIASKSWNDNGAIIIVESIDEAIKVSNKFAPEHLELMVDNARSHLKKIKNAGAIFLGPNTPEAVGDYVAGPSHVLPTSKSAKYSSGLSVFDFLKRTSITECSQENLNQIGPAAKEIAFNEGLDGHARSIDYRLTKK
ncbi:histidinol dehydrogenase [Pelagibacteraceae bacterium]|nr:histidinol dehydrogenase [Pelagibacteraceae bacterium]